jgi:hypothetical protein
MKYSIDSFSDHFALSFGFWMLYTLYTSFRIKLFIIKRYEKETNLSQTKYFKEWMPWTKHMPSFLKSVHYASHLWTFCSFRKNNNSDKILKKIRKNKMYDDILTPEQVTRHFSQKEIRRLKKYMVFAVISGIHAIAYFIFRFIWPEAFG